VPQRGQADAIKYFNRAEGGSVDASMYLGSGESPFQEPLPGETPVGSSVAAFNIDSTLTEHLA
jgi:hypothetical protein